MHLAILVKYLLAAWGVPIVIVVTVRLFTPDPGQSRENFASQSFTPARIWIVGGTGTKGADYFELRIENPAGEVFFHRDPERQPIVELRERIPNDTKLSILYSSSKLEGNVLMQIASEDSSSAKPALSFDDVMAEYGTRRKVVYIVAAVWCTLANLLAFALWKQVGQVER